MRIALRLVILLVIVLVVLFAGQAIETKRLASSHASRIADLREQGILGPTNPWAVAAPREAQAWVEGLWAISDAAAALPKLGFDVRDEWPDLAFADAAPILRHLQDLEAQLEVVPGGVSRVREPQGTEQRVATGPFTRGVPLVSLHSGIVVGSDVGREAVLGNLLAFAAHHTLSEPGGSRIAARRMGAVLELLEELDGGSLAVGQIRKDVERTWLDHLATLRELPDLDHVLFFRQLAPVLARVGTLERARRGQGRMLERSLGPGHAPWTEEPPSMAIFERGGRLDDACVLLDELETQLGILNTRADSKSPRLPRPSSTRVGPWRADRELGERCETDVAAARQLDLARVVLALDAHRQETDSWPEQLSELGRWFPEGIPTDPRTDAPFDYVLAGTIATVQVVSLSGGGPSSPPRATGPKLRWELEGEE